MPNKISSFEEAYLAGLHTVAELVDPRTQKGSRLPVLLELRLEDFHLYPFRQPTRIANKSVEQLIPNRKLRNLQSDCGLASDADSAISEFQRDVRSVHVVDLARAPLLLFGSPRICVHGTSIALKMLRI